MGGEASRPLPPWFATPTTEYPPSLSAAIQRLSSTARPFISGEPHYYSEFELEHHMNRLQGALSYDKNIAVWYPKLVPKHVTETEFWRNYFSHVAALVTEAQNNGQLNEVGTAAAVEEYRRGAGLPTDSPLGNGTSASPANVAASASSSPNSFPLSQTLKPQSNSVANSGSTTPQIQFKPTALLPSLLPTVTSTSTTPLRWGVIGCGARAKLVLPILTSLANSSITAIARQQPWKGVEQSAVNCATLFSILGLPAPARGPDASFVTLHTSIDSLVNDSQVDAIYVCTPTGTHARISEVASKSRKACIFDGTLARSAFELSPMLRQFPAANNTPMYATVAGVTCWSEKTRLLQTILSSKRLGDLRAVSVELHMPAIQSPWRSNAELNGGGPLMEVAHQSIQMLDALIGPLSLVHGDATHIPLSGAASSALPTENALSATFRAAGKGSSNAPILCTFSLSATSAMPLDRLSFTGTNARLLTSVFGADSPFISGSPPSGGNATSTVTTEVRLQRASDGTSSALEVQVQPFLPALSSTSSALSPADSATALSNFLTTVAAEIRQWKSNAPLVKDSISLTTMSFAARSTQVLDAILRDFYRDRSDFFWLRPQTWKRA